MKPDIFIDYGSRIKKRSKKMYRKSLKAIVKSKLNFISSANTTIFYVKEIGIQTKTFTRNFNQLDKYENDRSKL